MLIASILVGIALPFAGAFALFAAYLCLVRYAITMAGMRGRLRAEAAAEQHKGLPKSELEKLPATEAGGEEEGRECCVCLEGIERGQRTRVLPLCKHSFHLACLDQWLARNAACPVCRTSLLTLLLPLPLPLPINAADQNC
ncbi:hypothetical protein H6P81_019882 [Aristolochia fimbriata]|uniref:RING-type domain-containing protein n=1 Tax=Aristolochia fimbriata TaxID=158543 RepID=A0AAV7DT03_ARIFI|nr:hypothetical protein H6P81_019882 [Aristolochia fimbriata]